MLLKLCVTHKHIFTWQLACINQQACMNATCLVNNLLSQHCHEVQVCYKGRMRESVKNQLVSLKSRSNER